MNKKHIGLLISVFLTGCQTTLVSKLENKMVSTEEIKLKEYEEDLSWKDKKEIKNWVSSKLTNKFIKSDHFEDRKPSMLVLHHTDSNDDDATINIFTGNERNVSSHYLISRTGKIFQFIDERKRAFHAGASSWHNVQDINSASIGIEISNDMKTEYTEEQIESVIKLSKDIMERYKIRPDMVIGHLDIAPGRKEDPYTNFPWNRLAKEGVGIVCDSNYKNVKLPEIFSWKDTLTEIGYPANNMEKSLRSFRIHYFKNINKGKPTPQEKKYMFCLLKEINKSRFGKDYLKK